MTGLEKERQHFNILFGNIIGTRSLYMVLILNICYIEVSLLYYLCKCFLACSIWYIL